MTISFETYTARESEMKGKRRCLSKESRREIHQHPVIKKPQSQLTNAWLSN